MTRFARLILFLSSYSPLMVILAVRNPFDSLVTRLLLAAVAVVSVVFLLGMLSQAQRLAAVEITVAAARVRDGDVMSYVVTYFLPFLDVSRGKLDDAISLVLIYLVIAFIYVNSSLIYINPVRNVVGYRILEVDGTNHKTSTLVTKNTYVRAGQVLTVVSLDNYVILEKAT